MSQPVTSPSTSSSPSSMAGSTDSVLSRFPYIGFDLDHTLARYNLSEFAPFLFGLLRKHVVEMGKYPSRLLDVPFVQKEMHKALIWDSKLGHFLKLSDKKQILVATHGYPQRVLTPAEISADYSSEYPSCIISEFDGSKHPRWMPFYTYFEMPAQLLVALMVECCDRGEAPAWPPVGAGNTAATSNNHNKYASIFPILSAAFEFHLGPHGVLHGDYFPAFAKEPERFLLKRNEVVSWLKHLRRQGKFLFLATNSRMDYTEVLGRFSFGEDWRELFDTIIADCKKPSWFMIPGYATPAGPHVPKEFYHPHPVTMLADLTRAPATKQDVREGRGNVWIHGNANVLQEIFVDLERERLARLGLPVPSSIDPQVIYFGDHLHTDCLATRAYTSWASGAIVEEVEEHHDYSPSPEGKKKHQTFFGLSEKLAAAKSPAQASSSCDDPSHAHQPIFGSFFHHLPHGAAALAEATSSTGDSPHGLSTLPALAPTWSYWHHVLSQHCEVVVGCLTDLHEPEEVGSCVTESNGAGTASTSTSDPATSSSSSSQSPKTGPRLNSSCLLAPTFTVFLPPEFGADFRTVKEGTPKAESSNGSSKTPAELAEDRGLAIREPVVMQYSFHRVPKTMLAELRAIFPELSTFAADGVDGGGGGSKSLTAAEFKSLELLAIPTFQRAKFALVHVTPDIEAEKNRLLESFYAWSKRMCSYLRSLGCWADFVDPCTGYPTLGVHGSSTFSEVDSASVLLSYRTEQVGQCSMIDHPRFTFAHYPATIVTNATVEQTKSAVRHVQKELSLLPSSVSSIDSTPSPASPDDLFTLVDQLSLVAAQLRQSSQSSSEDERSPQRIEHLRTQILALQHRLDLQ